MFIIANMRRNRWILAALVLAATALAFVARRPSRDPTQAKSQTPRATAPLHKNADLPKTGSHLLEGEVGSESGSPIAGATIANTRSGSNSRSDHNGHWTLAWTNGDPIVASAPGFAPKRVTPADESEYTTIELTPYPNIAKGVIHDFLGGVVSDATVELQHSNTLPQWWPPTYKVLSNENGEYSIPIPTGTNILRAIHPDYVEKSVRVRSRGGTLEQDIQLVPGAVVSGRVLTVSSGSPVPNAVVTAGRRTTIANEFGSYEFRQLAPGKVTIGATASGLSSSFDVVTSLGVAEQQTGVDILLEDAANAAGFIQYASSGERVPGAKVHEQGLRKNSTEQTTDESGRFEVIGVGKRPLTLTISVEDCTTETRTFSDPTAAPLVISVECGHMILGTVSPPSETRVTAAATPAPRAFLVQGLDAVSETVSSTDGTFRLGPLPDGEYSVRAVARSGWEGTADLHIRGKDETVDILLEERFSVEGTLLDTEGSPISHGEVELTPPPSADIADSDSVPKDRIVSGTTTTDGVFSLAGLLPGSYDVTVYDKGGQPLPIQVPVPSQLEIQQRDVQDFDVVAEAGTFSIQGTVIGSTAEGSNEAWVRAIPESRTDRAVLVGVDLRVVQPVGELPPPVMSDTEGDFEIRGLVSGRYRLEAESLESSSFASLANVEAGSRVVLELEPGGQIEGRVTEDGRPLEHFRLDLEGPSPSTLRCADDAGRFALDGLKPGEYIVYASKPHEKTGPGQKVVVDAGGTTSVRLDLRPLVAVVGRLVDDDGHPIGEATVFPVGVGGPGAVYRHESAITGPNGEFELDLPPGDVRITTYGYPRHQHRRAIPAQENFDLGTLQPVPMDLILRALQPAP